MARRFRSRWCSSEIVARWLTSPVTALAGNCKARANWPPRTQPSSSRAAGLSGWPWRQSRHSAPPWAMSKATRLAAGGLAPQLAQQSSRARRRPGKAVSSKTTPRPAGRAGGPGPAGLRPASGKELQRARVPGPPVRWPRPWPAPGPGTRGPRAASATARSSPPGSRCRARALRTSAAPHGSTVRDGPRCGSWCARTPLATALTLP